MSADLQHRRPCLLPRVGAPARPLPPRRARARCCSSGRRSTCAAASARSSSSSATIYRPTCRSATWRPWRRARRSRAPSVFARAMQPLRRALESHRADHRAHPLRLARQHAAQDDPREHGGARAAGRWSCTRTARASTSFIAACPRPCAATSTARCSARTCSSRCRAQWRDFYVHECELSPSQVVVLPNPVRWCPRACPTAPDARRFSSCTSAVLGTQGLL